MELLFFFIIIIPSAIIHEYAHGWTADRLGDPTARYAGRLTLDPRSHIDKWGTLLMPLMLFLLTGGKFLFAYAKPVPYNPANLTDSKYGPAKVALAGPASNLALALLFGLSYRFMPDVFSTSLVPQLFSFIVLLNLILAVFNLFPIPPLDGHWLLMSFLPARFNRLKVALYRYNLVLLLIFLLFIFPIVLPLIYSLFRFIVGGGV